MTVINPLMIKIVSLRRAGFWALLLTLLLWSGGFSPPTLAYSTPSAPAGLPAAGGQRTVGAHELHLPLAATPNWDSPFAVEYYSSRAVTRPQFMRGIEQLGVDYLRMNIRLSWRTLQPNPGEPLRWGEMAQFEEEVRALQAQGISVIPIVYDSPEWAAIDDPFYTPCGAIREDRFDEFADFMKQVVARYSRPEFGIHKWEMWNEPDADPRLTTYTHLGCWGDSDDPFYGGRHYGEMLKVVTPAIKSVDPTAEVWLGGLLLYTYNTHWVDQVGKPESFMRGVLESGAGPYFDVLAYHAHAYYTNDEQRDHELFGIWADRGGYVIGKARFLQQLMAEYGVPEKPLWVNEFSMVCPSSNPTCVPPSPIFFQAQANHAVRSAIRGMSAGVDGYVWYSMNSGWRYTDLLQAGQPTATYVAYQTMNEQLRYTKYNRTVGYGPGIEGYVFAGSSKEVHVVWAHDPGAIDFLLPKHPYIKVADRDGNPLPLFSAGSSYQLTARFDPIYITIYTQPSN